MQHYVIKFVNDLQVRWFSQSTPVFSTNETDRRDITEILLKVALNYINHNHIDLRFQRMWYWFKVMILNLRSKPTGTFDAHYHCP